MTMSIFSLETAMTAPVQGNVCVGDDPGIYGGIVSDTFFAAVGVTNGEWRGGSNSMQGAGVKNTGCRLEVLCVRHLCRNLTRRM